jgi:hypothetical protein
MSHNTIAAAQELLKKALSFGREGQATEERAAYDEIISRFSDMLHCVTKVRKILDTTVKAHYEMQCGDCEDGFMERLRGVV